MFVRPKNDDVSALSHDGETYAADEEGRFEVPAQLGEWLIRAHGFETTEAPAEASDKPKRKPAARK